MENTNIIIKEYFNNEHLSEVTMIKDSENVVWFKGIDVALILGYTDKKQAIRKNVEMEDKIKLNELTKCLG